MVITGAGGHFCGGGDLQRLAHNRAHDLSAQADSMDAFHQWMEVLRCFPKPVIAAVEGVAAGGGVSVALACDLIVAGENSRFSMAHSKVALSPDGGASWHLTRALGRSRALALLWLGDTQTAQQWAQCGWCIRWSQQERCWRKRSSLQRVAAKWPRRCWPASRNWSTMRSSLCARTSTRKKPLPDQPQQACGRSG